MPKKSLLYQQYRRTMGNHTNWQDKKQGSQQDQDKRAQRLALQPGLYTGNVHRHNASQAMVQLLSTLSAAQISSANPAISPQRADELSRTNPRYGGNYNRSPGTERPLPIRDPGGAMYSTSAGNFIPADSPSPSTTSMNALGYQNPQLPIHSTTNDELNFPSRSNPFSALRQKRSFFLSHNIPNKILDIISDIRFDSSLRLTLDHIRILAEQAPEVKYASEEDKNVFLLLKCIQEMNREIKDKNLPSTGEAQVMLGALFEIADSLDAPHEKTIVNEFKQRLDSERDSIGATGLSSTRPPGMLQGMHSGGGPAALAPEEQSRVMSLEQDRVYNHLLTKARAFYDIERGVLISDEQEMRVITSFLNQQIFDMSLDELCMSFVTRKSMPVSFISMELDYYVYDRIDYYYIGRQSLSVEELAFYKNHVLSKSLPTIALQLSAGENVELNNLLVTQPQWGFVHAGAMLLTDSGAGLNGLTLADITDVGITLFTMLRQRAVPQEYNEYFRLPALLYYAATKPNLPDSLKLLDLDMQQVYLHYFNYIKSWEIRNNPLEQLPDSIEGWKTRTELAREQFMRYGVPDQYLSDYLNYHREMRFNKLPPFGYSYKPIGSFTLPNIDTVFDEQNRKLADTVYEVDKLLLPIVFNSLSEAEQRFIEQSKVDKVRVQFNAQDTWIPHSALIVVGELTPPESLVFHIPDRIDLLQCTLNGEERIYALETNKDNGNYKMRRVDRDRQALLWLLDDITVPSRDPDYKLRVTSHTTLKSCAESPQTLIDNLAEHHRKRLLTALTEKGYDKTTQEKVVDFMLGLIPFYTCITEGLKGNEREAIPACMFDVINLIPFAGQAAVTGFRFGRALAGSTAMALRYGARQATIKGMLKQTGKTLIPLFPPIAQEISAQVAKGLGSGFLRSVDPGFELLASGGAKGIRAMRNILTKMPTRSKGLIRLSDALGKKSAGLSSVPDNTNLMIESVFSPAHGRYLDVTVVGEERSKRIWAQINRETGEVFGQRFTLDGNGNLEAIESRLNQQSVEARGPSLSKPSAKKTVPKKDALDGRLTKYTISEIKNYALMNNLIMFKHHIPDSHYIQYYTKSPGTKKGSEVLVVSAHGGFRDRDTLAPVVVLPSDITIQMLTPHGTRLKDPTLDHVVNGWKYLRTYVTITKGKVRKVDFLPQQGHSQWHYDDSYDPTDKYNTLGRVDGLQNYRHIRFEGESDMLIANVLIKNRELAKMGKADLTDVLTVDTRITEVTETSLEKASVQRVLELDREGKLTNEKGHRYKRIAFCHCRCRVEPPFDLTSSYYMVPMDLENMMEQAASKGSKISEVEMTVLHREDVNSEFAIQRYTIGRFIFTAVNQIDQSTVSLLESDPFIRG